MDTQITDTTLIALCSGLVGMVIGAMAARLLQPRSLRQMETQLQETEQKLQKKNAQIAPGTHIP